MAYLGSWLLVFIRLYFSLSFIYVRDSFLVELNGVVHDNWRILRSQTSSKRRG